MLKMPKYALDYLKKYNLLLKRKLWYILTCNSYIGPKDTQPKREVVTPIIDPVMQLEINEFHKLIDI